MVSIMLKAFSCTLYTFMLIHIHAASSSFVPSENIALSCGSRSSEIVSNTKLGRNWIADIGSKYLSNDAKSETSKAPKSNNLQVPYKKARIFRSKLTYTFSVKPGSKFVRLHFYPASYEGLDVSKAFVSASSGNVTLLNNFSPSLHAAHSNATYIIKEYIIVVSGDTLEITLNPPSDFPDSYAFLNGIEIVTKPTSLYIRGDHAPLPLVGHYPALFYVSNESAMETLYRINIGGGDISPEEDTGMSRAWSRDDPYLFGAQRGETCSDFHITLMYPSSEPTYTAPESIYRTARTMSYSSDNAHINLNYNLTWSFPIDPGFRYLVRLHFCELIHEITMKNQRVFQIFINNQTAEDAADVIAWSGGHGVPVFRDYVVLSSGKIKGKQELLLALHPNVHSNPMYYNAIVNGLEIFKLSSADGNLAGVNPVTSESCCSLDKKSSSNKTAIFIGIGCGVGAVLTVLIVLRLLVYRFKRSDKTRMLCNSLFSRKSTPRKKAIMPSFRSPGKPKMSSNDSFSNVELPKGSTEQGVTQK